MKRGDIVLIRYPFTDLSSDKVRPALVISSDSYMQKSKDAIFVCFSSNINNQESTDVLINQEDPEFSTTGLKKSSLVKTAKIVILEKSLAHRLLGQADPKIMQKVDNMLADVLGLSTAVPSQLKSQDSQKEQATNDQKSQSMNSVTQEDTSQGPA